MRTFGIWLAAALALSGTAHAQEQPTSTIDALAREADTFFAGQQPGGVVLVTRGDEVLLRRAYGQADIENAVTMRPEAAMRLASVSKQFTAVAVLQLVEAGRLRLDAALGTLDPGLTGPMAAVTVQQLLTHTSGIRNISSIPESRAARRQDTDAASLMGWFQALPLEFAPGTRFRYSNSNYIVLTHLIQHITSQSYADYMQQAIFAPLGMRHTRYDDHRAIIDARARGYRRAQGILQNADFIAMSQPQGAGGLISTVDDLAIWHRALRDNTLVTAALSERATAKTTLADGTPSPYGFGWIIGEVQGARDVEHGGFINGFNSYVVRLSSPDVFATVLTNAEFLDPTQLTVRLAAIAAGTPYGTPVDVVARDTAWLGRYRFADDDVRVLSQVDGRLQLLRDGEEEVPVTVTPATDGRYYLDGGTDYLQFAQDDTGTVVVTLHDRLMGLTRGRRVPTVESGPATGSTHP